MITLKDGSAHDVAAIMAIMNEAFDPDYGERWNSAQCVAMLSIPDTSLLLASYNGAIVGFAITRWVMDEEELLLIGVTKAYQRRGIGSHVVNHIIDRAIENNRQTIFLEVRDNNKAKDFYTQKGFRDIGRRKNYYTGQNGNIFDAVTMSLDILQHNMTC